MNNQEGEIRSSSYKHDDHHDMVMPGFRFHPTEEEIIDFYLRRKVEGKRFNVELITLLDLYRYDPWELPALAAIGGKEWYFYVRRDRKYRNGDRPSRVTASGYWKSTGADRTIKKSEDFRAVIGLKKTLVFYSGKAPKGVRSSWIMNEYRLLPLHEIEKLEKGEICLCRVYKRAGIIQENPSLQIPPRAASSSSNESSISTLFTRNHHRSDRTSSISSSSSIMIKNPLAADTDDDLLKLVMNNSLLITSSSSSCLSNPENPNRVHGDGVYPNNNINVPYNLLLPSSSSTSQISASQLIAYTDTMWDYTNLFE